MRLFKRVPERMMRRITRLEVFTVLIGIGLVVIAGTAMLLHEEQSAMAGLMKPPTQADIEHASQVEAPIAFQGVKRPPTRTAEATTWNDDELVIGINVDDEFRAYRLRCMRTPDRHVVNDVVGEKPISVSYCNLYECVRAFSGEPSGEPLNLSVGGLRNDRGMILKVNGKRYYQDTLEPADPETTSTAFPYEETEYSVTTWKLWREAHPDTLTARLGHF